MLDLVGVSVLVFWFASTWYLTGFLSIARSSWIYPLCALLCLLIDTACPPSLIRKSISLCLSLPPFHTAIKFFQKYKWKPIHTFQNSIQVPHPGFQKTPKNDPYLPPCSCTSLFHDMDSMPWPKQTIAISRVHLMSSHFHSNAHISPFTLHHSQLLPWYLLIKVPFLISWTPQTAFWNPYISHLALFFFFFYLEFYQSASYLPYKIIISCRASMICFSLHFLHRVLHEKDVQ